MGPQVPMRGLCAGRGGYYVMLRYRSVPVPVPVPYEYQ